MNPRIPSSPWPHIVATDLPHSRYLVRNADKVERPDPSSESPAAILLGLAKQCPCHHPTSAMGLGARRTGRLRAVLRVSPDALFASLAATTALTAGSTALAQAVATAPDQQAADRSATSDAPPPAQPAGIAEIVVTAQKRAQSINKVPMSITALSGTALTSLGVMTTAQLTKVVPGFNFTETVYGTPVYTIRGVGFQESSLAGSPAVSVYVDEVPLPFPVESEAASLDLERVEVLKGPQGTLYGANSTGGAVNYIAAKPTDHLTAGVDASIARFDATDINGYVSGPLSDTLTARLSARLIESGDWQKSYTDARTLGAQNRVEARLLLDWHPTDRLTISTNFNVFRDRSQTPAEQFEGIYLQSKLVPIPSGLTGFPIAPPDDRAADWDPGRDYRRNNLFYQFTLRGDYKLTDLVTLSSITSWQHYFRDQPLDPDGTTFENDYFTEGGSISTIYQELRLGGRSFDRLNWIVGFNYEGDNTDDINSLEFPQSSTARLAGFPLTDVNNQTRQNIRTYAVYGNLDYDLTSAFTVHGGIRLTQTDRDFSGCSADTGDGQAAAALNFLSSVLRGGVPGTKAQPGQCVTLDATFQPSLITAVLNEKNVAWRTGVDWHPRPNFLTYFNVSKGYKSGSFPTLTASSYVQFAPVKQESVLAFEAGTKVTLFDRKLQLNAAAFYYDYANKQIRGIKLDPIFGSLAALVSIPKSHIDGFELSATARPTSSLTITPAVTMVHSRIDGNFSNYNPLGQLGRFVGEAFPYTPEWSGNVGVDYQRPLNDRLNWFLGGNLSYQGATNGGFGELPTFRVRAYALLDLRAGIASASGRWRATVFGENLTNQYYWVSAEHAGDVIVRQAGRPLSYGLRLSYRFD